MPVPRSLAPELSAYLTELEGRIAQLETPQGFSPAFLTTSARLTPASAAAQAGRFGLARDLKTFVWSDGVRWRRADTGAVIV